MPAGIWLSKFGEIITDYFGAVSYQVGSSLHSKDWRDVDVRLILADPEFERRFGSNRSAVTNVKLAAVTLAFSALGAAMTGLPIDFQIQPESHANGAYGDQPRDAWRHLCATARHAMARAEEPAQLDLWGAA